jgi:hypothetical protein
MKIDIKTTTALLEKYGLHIAKGEHAVPPGTDIAIDGWTEAGGRRLLRVRSAAHAVERLVPIGDAGAGHLADGLRAHHHRLHGEAVRSMLHHLFLRVSDLFEHEDVEQLSFDPVRLHENEYTIVHAKFFAPSLVHVPERLGRHARDHKTFRASGEQ